MWGRAKGSYIMVLLEKLRGLGCCVFVLGLILNNACIVDGQVDLGWCSHDIVVSA